jgi:hypothetical protein
MSLFSGSDFPPEFDVPQGQSEIPNPTHGVLLTLQDGGVVSVFSTTEVALRCLRAMKTRGQWFLQASEDVVVVSNGSKLLLLEASLVNQKMLQQFACISLSGRMLFQHRNCSQIVTLTAALQQSGYCMKAPLPFAGNLDLRSAPNPPAIQLVDWFYDAFPADSTSGSQLASALVYLT